MVLLLVTACDNGNATLINATSASDDNAAIQLKWSPPTQREDGSLLEEREIAAYELKYRPKGSTAYKSIIIRSETLNSGPVTNWSLSNLASGDYEFLLATIDRDGLRSDYVSPQR